MSKQTALEQLYEKIENQDMGEVPMYVYDFIEQAKQMEKEQLIDAYTQGDKDGYPDGSYITGEQYYNETYGSKGSDECYFEPMTNTSSATICKHCGREKFLHNQIYTNELQQIDQNNPVTRGSTALVRVTSSQTEISDEEIDRQAMKYANDYGGTINKPIMWGYDSFKYAIKWYREQLKQRQNG